jgi:hypothetical protein
MRTWPRAFPLCIAAAFALLPPTSADTPPADTKKTDDTGMTAEQVLLFNEYVEVAWQLKLRTADPTKKPDLNRAAFYKEMLNELVNQSPEEKRVTFRWLPGRVLRMHRALDPLYLSKAEEDAAEKLPASVAPEVKRLLSDDTEVFLDARRGVLAQGIGCKKPISDQIRKLEEDSAKRLRLVGLLRELDAQVAAEHCVRISEDAFKREADLRKTQGNGKKSKIAALLPRHVVDFRGHPDEDPFAALCYFNFKKSSHDYDSATGLEFHGGDRDHFQIHMLGGQDHRMTDLGEVDFEELKSAPDAKTTAAWPNRRGDSPAIVGHVYLEHCFCPGDVDLTVKFKILDLKPGEWVIIEWQLIPQEKSPDK